MPPLRSWRMADEKERIGIHEIKYITNLYRLWDDLLAKYPDLVIDNCAAGGRRIDIEMLNKILMYAHPPHPSDPENPARGT